MDERAYRRRVRAWALYDWANSAFATTILAAVLPVYYSQVAGATLPSPAIATRNWSITLSISLFIVALLSPILGTISDIIRGKKKLLSIFVAIGVIGTGLLVLVDTGDWVLASILFIIGRVGFAAANVFYDALLPHVARPEDRDRVSAYGYALGYLGGGLLLAINVAMIAALPGTWGARLSFLSVAIWWAVFSIPLFRHVPEPPSATERLAPGESLVAVSFRRLAHTLREIRRYRQLFLFLIAFLIYNDGIGTIIGMAAIYGAELGFSSVELILAILLVQFVGIPFSLLFGRIPSRTEPGARRAFFVAFVVFNLVALPLVGMVAARTADPAIVGASPPPFEATGDAIGQGTVDAPSLERDGAWTTLSADTLPGTDRTYLETTQPDASARLRFNGERVRIVYAVGPDAGIWAVLVDGRPLLDDGEPVEVDAYDDRVGYDRQLEIDAGEPGEHVIEIVNTGRRAEASSGTALRIAAIEVLAPRRVSNLGVILGGLLALQLLGLLFAAATRRWFARFVDALDTKRTIVLALVVYSVIAVWGYLLDAVIEFWFLAWMVAMVQGGSQALSRSLYAAMSPRSMSGEFFGLFSIMSKFSSILGPLVFAGAVALFDSSRPAILSIVVFFVVGILLLARVDVDEGVRVAAEVDARILGEDDGSGS